MSFEKSFVVLKVLIPRKMCDQYLLKSLKWTISTFKCISACTFTFFCRRKSMLPFFLEGRHKENLQKRPVFSYNVHGFTKGFIARKFALFWSRGRLVSNNYKWGPKFAILSKKHILSACNPNFLCRVGIYA